jgi:hypothetical protein
MWSVLKPVQKLLAMKQCPFWTPSTQVALKLQASILKLKAEVKALPGAGMHGTLLTPADLVAPLVVREIAGAECTLNPAVLLLVLNGTMTLAQSALTLVNVAVPQTGKGEQLCIIVQMFAPVRVLLGTAEHVIDEAPAFIYGVFMGFPISNRRVFLTNSLVGGGRALGD